MNPLPRDATWWDAKEFFDARDLVGQVFDPTTGDYCRLPVLCRVRVLELVGALLASIAGIEVIAGIADRDAIDRLRLRPYLDAIELRATLDEPAHEASREIANALRCVLRTLFPRPTKQMRRVTLDEWHPGWRAAAAATPDPEDPTTPAARRKDRANVHRLHVHLVAAGVTDPERLPDRASLHALLEQHGVKQKAIARMFASYRRARTTAGRLEWPALARGRAHAPRGIKSLTDLVEQMRTATERHRAAGTPCMWTEARDPLGMPVLEILAVVAPQLANETTKYLEHARYLSDAHREKVVALASCFAADAIRLKEDMFTLRLLDFFAQLRRVPRRDPHLTEGLEGDDPTRTEDEVPLIQLLLETGAGLSYLRSPIRLRNPEQNPGVVPRFPQTVRHNFENAWRMLTVLYRDRPAWRNRPGNAALWETLETTYDQLLAYMLAYNAAREVEGQKDVRLLRVSLAQAICMGLPRLRRACWNAERTWRDLCRTAAPTERGRRAVARAYRQYCGALDRYIVPAMVLANGVRRKNYSNMRCGVNVVVAGEPCPAEWDGLPETIREVTHLFDDTDRIAGLKPSRVLEKKPKRLAVTVARGILDLALFAQWKHHVRLDALVAAGKYASRDAYDPGTDQYALFVSPHRGTRKEAYAAFDDRRVATKFGQFLYWMQRDVLQLPGLEGHPLPPWHELRRSKVLWPKYRAVFSVHSLRNLIATYIGGHLGEWQEAMRLTGDTKKVLKDIYENSHWKDENVRATRPYHLCAHFDDLMRHIRSGYEPDWDTFDELHPERTAYRLRFQPEAPADGAGTPSAAPPTREGPADDGAVAAAAALAASVGAPSASVPPTGAKPRKRGGRHLPPFPPDRCGADEACDLTGYRRTQFMTRVRRDPALEVQLDIRTDLYGRINVDRERARRFGAKWNRRPPHGNRGRTLRVTCPDCQAQMHPRCNNCAHCGHVFRAEPARQRRSPASPSAGGAPPRGDASTRPPERAHGETHDTGTRGDAAHERIENHERDASGQNEQTNASNDDLPA